jgi:diaminopimelate epimerase
MLYIAAEMNARVSNIPFVKMNGLGNDFAVVQAPLHAFDPSVTQVRAWGDREHGIGFDQLIVLSDDGSPDSKVVGPLVRFWNSDGEAIGACGNGSRCVGWLLMEAARSNHARFHTHERNITAERAGEHRVTVDMGAPRLRWDEIPLSEEMDTRGIELEVGPAGAPILHTPGCVSMGNPHVVFFTPDVEALDVARIGSMIEHHPLFPRGVNVGFCEVRADDLIRLRVWERGAGLTKACGTGACAALVAAARRRLCGRSATVVLDGGALQIEWREADDHVLMTGAVEVEFTGVLP